MTAPKKRIPWGHGETWAKEDIAEIRHWEKGYVSDEALCDELRYKYSLDDFSDAEIMENLRWLGYKRKKSNWKGE